MPTPASSRVPPALRWAGVAACIAAALPLAAALAETPERLAEPRSAGALAAFGFFGAAFLAASSERVAWAPRRGVGRALLALQSAAAIAAVHLAPALAVLVLAVVVAAQLPRFVPLAAAWAWLAALTGAMAPALRFETLAPLLVVVGIFGAFEVFALYTALVTERERQAREELGVAYANLRSARAVLDERARQAERERLTAEIHDLLGHDLVALKLNLDAAKRRSADEALRAELAHCEEVATRALEDVRGLVRTRRVSAGLDLAAAARAIAADIPAPHVHVDAPDTLVLEDADVAEAALRCLQEAVTNAVRHSGARDLRLCLTRDGARLVVEARDDGCGSRGEGASGGLASLAERARRLGGTLRAENLEPNGFELRMELPVKGAVS